MTRTVPKLRQRVVGSPISPAPPRWETDPNFDLNYHLRIQRLARRGGLRDVLEIAERISEQDFDRSRPLWELTLVTGMTKRQSAVIFKIHHAITDGVGGMAMMAALFDLTRHPDTELGPMPDAPAPHEAELADRFDQALRFEAADTTSQLKGAVIATAGFTKRAVADPISTAISTQQWTASALRLLSPAMTPRSDVMTNRSLSVAFSIIEVPLDDLKASAKVVSGTLNDAFMAAVTGGLRRYHVAHDSEVESLRVNMPVNLRTDPQDGGGNRWVPARFEIPIALRSADARMRQLHPILQQARDEPALGLSDAVNRTLNVLPRPITAQLAGGLMKGIDFAATNVPGPPIPLYACGAEAIGIIPFAPKGGAAVNVALLTYNGECFVGINADRAAIEDPEELTQCMADAFAEVLDVGRPPPT